MWKVRSTGSPGLGGRGLKERPSGYSTGSGMPGTIVIPHRGHLPGAADRTSASIGQTYCWGVGGGVCPLRNTDRQTTTDATARRRNAEIPSVDEASISVIPDSL